MVDLSRYLNLMELELGETMVSVCDAGQVWEAMKLHAMLILRWVWNEIEFGIGGASVHPLILYRPDDDPV